MDLSRLLGRGETAAREQRADGRDRTPPGQYVTKKWPVLSYESTPRFDPATYRFRVWGEVEHPIELTWDELRALPQTTLTTDIHCVTTWSRYDNTWQGIPIREILDRVRPKPTAKYVMEHSWTGYTTNLPFESLAADDVLIAFSWNGEPITPEHGGPVRMVVPQLYFYKSAKWLSGLEFLREDAPGFWERNGYSNSADPWKDERYW